MQLQHVVSEGWLQLGNVGNIFRLQLILLVVLTICEWCSIPFFVAAPTTTLDAKLAAGSEITIEHRPANEVTHFQGKQVAPDGIDVSQLAHVDQVPLWNQTQPVRLLESLYKLIWQARPLHCCRAASFLPATCLLRHCYLF